MLIAEQFKSLQGETTSTGLRCAFVRLAGCNLRCRWCDTVWAQSADGGVEQTVEQVVAEVAGMGCPRVAITGGEPLLQGETPRLVSALAALGLDVMVETNGSLDIGALPEPCRRILDIKPPSSGMAGRMDFGNLDRLRPGDEIKIVIASEDDFHWAADLTHRHQLDERVPVIFQPAHGHMPLGALAELILAQTLDIRLGVQLHKLVWPGVERGV